MKTRKPDPFVERLRLPWYSVDDTDDNEFNPNNPDAVVLRNSRPKPKSTKHVRALCEPRMQKNKEAKETQSVMKVIKSYRLFSLQRSLSGPAAQMMSRTGHIWNQETDRCRMLSCEN